MTDPSRHYRPRRALALAKNKQAAMKIQAVCQMRVEDAKAMGAPVLAASWQSDLNHVHRVMAEHGWTPDPD